MLRPNASKDEKIVSPYFAGKNGLILQKEWLALSLFFSILAALICIAYVTQEKIDKDSVSQHFVAEENCG